MPFLRTFRTFGGTNMKRKGLFFALLVCLPLLSSAQLKVAYFNPKLALSSLDDFKALETKMQEYGAQREAAYNKQAEAFQAEVNDFQQKMSALPEAKRKEEEARLATKRQELQEMANAAQREIQQKQADLLKPLFDKISATIKTIALEQKLDFVFNQSTNGGENILLYVDEGRKPTLDITQKVIDKLKKP